MAGGRVEPSGYFTRVYLCGGDQRGPEGSRDVSWLYGHPGGMVVLLRGSWGGGDTFDASASGGINKLKLQSFSP